MANNDDFQAFQQAVDAVTKKSAADLVGLAQDKARAALRPIAPDHSEENLAKARSNVWIPNNRDDVQDANAKLWRTR